MKRLPIEVFEAAHVRPTAGRVLICGSKVYPGREDRRALYSDALGVDLEEGEGVDVAHDLERALPARFGKFAHVECLSVLEHARRPWMVAQTIERAMVPGASLFLSVPFVWRVHAYPNDYWRFTVEGVRELFPRIEWDALTYATHKLAPKGVRGIEVSGNPYFPRAEVFGFGRKQ